MQDIEIKKVTAEDAEFLYSLMNEPEVLRALNEVPTSREDWMDAIQAWAEDGDEEDYIIWKENVRVGWFAFNGLEADDSAVYLKMAVILPEFQRMGIGSYVLARLLDEVRAGRYREVVLYTNKENLRAQKCYRKCGFTVAEELTERMSDGEVVERYRMVCEL